MQCTRGRPCTLSDRASPSALICPLLTNKVGDYKFISSISRHGTMSDTSNTNKRLAVLQRHLASATVEEHHEAHRDPASAQLPSTSVLYDWLVRDNAELREAIFDFMKASRSIHHTRHDTSCSNS